MRYINPRTHSQLDERVSESLPRVTLWLHSFLRCLVISASARCFYCAVRCGQFTPPDRTRQNCFVASRRQCELDSRRLQSPDCRRLKIWTQNFFRIFEEDRPSPPTAVMRPTCRIIPIPVVRFSSVDGKLFTSRPTECRELGISKSITCDRPLCHCVSIGPL